MNLGVCYYPEHWSPERWAQDAAHMADIGIRQVRIGEFAWSRIEPSPGQFDWSWLDRAIDTLHQAGLEIVLGTPTATPPKWLIDAKPDILAVDAHGRPRQFGSRRHYCFSSATYRLECARVVEALASRYGTHPAIKAWQTDNEYGCHDTIHSFSAAARQGFRVWLAHKYGTISALNEAWGNVFWSMEYREFSEIDPPIETVTEANPSHRLDWARFASDEVVAFNRIQTQILRAHSPGRDILHNYMGMFTSFDHFKVGQDLDLAAWDSYPLGFLEQAWWPTETKERYLRQGHPDFTAFHHDLYRGVGRGRWQVIEQQPGPVNWASWNPAPLPGMVRAWTWEAFAHGAECVSYFRWRQAPFAQEHMHAGLLRPDHQEGPAAREARQVSGELAQFGEAATEQAHVALLFDYEAIWATQSQPQGRDYRPLELVLAFYTAARRLGLTIDVIHPSTRLDGYKLILCPLSLFWSKELSIRIKASGASCVLGPRTGSKTEDFQIPPNLAPGNAQDLIPLVVSQVESLRPGHVEKAGPYKVTRWLEHCETALEPLAQTATGQGIWYQNDLIHYLACWPDEMLLETVLNRCCQTQCIPVVALPAGLRLRQRGNLMVAINYEAYGLDLCHILEGASSLDYVIGGPDMPAAGVAVWRLK